MEEKLIGIVCSTDLREAYCFERSTEYNRMKDRGELEGKKVVYIDPSFLRLLIPYCFDKDGFEINAEKVADFSKRTEALFQRPIPALQKAL